MELLVTISDKGSVEAFLKKWHEACTHSIFFIERKKNLISIAQLGWTLNLAKEELKKLTASNYVKGPEPDRDKPGEFWFFGRPSHLGDIYIKVKIFEVKGKAYAKCVSFHLAEYPLKYKFK